MFTWLGRFNYRHRRGILGVAGAFIVFAVVWGGGVFGAMGSGGYSPPDAETNRANALLEQRFGHRPGDLDALAVYTDPTGTRTVDDPAFAAAVQNALRRLDPTEVLSAVSYWSPDRTPDQREQMVSRDRHSTYAVLTLHGDNDDERLRAYAAIQDDVRADGLDTHLGGGFTSEHQLQLIAARNLADSQVVALPILLILLVLFFGGVLAGVLPPALGVTRSSARWC